MLGQQARPWTCSSPQCCKSSLNAWITGMSYYHAQLLWFLSPTLPALPCSMWHASRTISNRFSCHCFFFSLLLFLITFYCVQLQNCHSKQRSQWTTCEISFLLPPCRSWRTKAVRCGNRHFYYLMAIYLLTIYSWWCEPQVLSSKSTADRPLDRFTGGYTLRSNPICKALGTPVFWIVTSVEILWNPDISPFHNGIHPKSLSTV